MSTDTNPKQDLAALIAAALPDDLQPVGVGFKVPSAEMPGYEDHHRLTGYGRMVVDALVPALSGWVKPASVWAAEGRADAAERELRARELHHFETEKENAELKGALAELRAENADACTQLGCQAIDRTNEAEQENASLKAALAEANERADMLEQRGDQWKRDAAAAEAEATGAALRANTQERLKKAAETEIERLREDRAAHIEAGRALAAELDGRRTRAVDLKAALARVEALLKAEMADVIEARVRAARADVRCLDCNLRYDERQEYGCHESGRGHSYSEGDLAAAEEIERSGTVEHVTLSVADLRAALPARDEEGGDV